MKTTKTIISAILVALATVTLGQQDFNKKIKSSVSGRQGHYLSYEVAYNALPASFTLYKTGAGCIGKADAGVEDWMTVPFESSVLDHDLAVENWMTTPFKNEMDQEGLYVESWMATPFESQVVEEDLVLEKWMTTPFEYETADDDLCLESWMTTPFEIQNSEWMFAAVRE
jgi:hypothetical protein